MGIDLELLVDVANSLSLVKKELLELDAISVLESAIAIRSEVAISSSTLEYCELLAAGFTFDELFRQISCKHRNNVGELLILTLEAPRVWKVKHRRLSK